MSMLEWDELDEDGGFLIFKCSKFGSVVNVDC